MEIKKNGLIEDPQKTADQLSFLLQSVVTIEELAEAVESLVNKDRPKKIKDTSPPLGKIIPFRRKMKSIQF